MNVKSLNKPEGMNKENSKLEARRKAEVSRCRQKKLQVSMNQMYIKLHNHVQLCMHNRHNANICLLSYTVYQEQAMNVIEPAETSRLTRQNKQMDKQETVQEMHR